MSKILTHPHKILRQKAQPVMVFDQNIKLLAQELIDSLVPDPREPLGVGLAANQIGSLWRIFIMMFANRKLEIIINPQIIKSSSQKLSSLPKDKQYLEGCLSVPGYYAFVDRPVKIKVIYQTLTGSLKRKTLNTPYSTYFQHENDHLNGILFIDHVKKSQEQMFFGTGRGQLKPVKNPF